MRYYAWIQDGFLGHPVCIVSMYINMIFLNRDSRIWYNTRITNGIIPFFIEWSDHWPQIECPIISIIDSLIKYHWKLNWV